MQGPEGGGGGGGGAAYSDTVLCGMVLSVNCLYIVEKECTCNCPPVLYVAYSTA